MTTGRWHRRRSPPEVDEIVVLICITDARRLWCKLCETYGVRDAEERFELRLPRPMRT